MMIFLALYSRAQLLLGARKSPTKNSAAAFLETQSNESVVCCLARRQRDLSGERCVPNERHARNNNNTKQIPDKIPTAGKNV